MDTYTTYPHLGNPQTDAFWVMRHSGTYNGETKVGEIRFFASDWDTAIGYIADIIPAGDVVIYLSKH